LGASRRGKAANDALVLANIFLPCLHFSVSLARPHMHGLCNEVTPGADIGDWGSSGVGLPLQAAAVIYVEVASVVHCCF
jgi:hypothetical protein